MKYTNIHILRGIAAISVLLYYFQYYLINISKSPNTFMQIFSDGFSYEAYLFFVISGFLINQEQAMNYMVAGKFQGDLLKTINRYFSPLQLQNMSESKIAHIMLFLILAIIMFFRRPDALLNPQPWAEDGLIFIQQAITHPINSFFISYAGYFHTIPRLVTLLSLQFGLSNTPFIMNFLSLIIASTSISFLFNRKFRFIIKNDLLRFICAIFIVLLPVYEIFLNITNIQWFLSIYLALWVSSLIFNYELSSQRKLSFLAVLETIFTVLAFLSTPLSFILIPFLIYVMIKEIRRRETLFSLNFCIFYLFPIISFLTYSAICLSITTSQNIEIPPLINFFRLFSSEVVTKLFLSHSNIIVSDFGYNLTYIISILVIMILILAIITKKDFTVDIFLMALIFFSILLISLSRPGYIEIFSSRNIGGGERFVFFPMAWLLILFFRHFTTFDKSKKRYIIYAFLAIVFLNLLLNYQFQPFDNLNFKLYAEHFDPNGHSSCIIPINPQGWSITIPCKH